MLKPSGGKVSRRHEGGSGSGWSTVVGKAKEGHIVDSC
jgi:hypothetical protein